MYVYVYIYIYMYTYTNIHTYSIHYTFVIFVCAGRTGRCRPTAKGTRRKGHGAFEVVDSRPVAWVE